MQAALILLVVINGVSGLWNIADAANNRNMASGVLGSLNWICFGGLVSALAMGVGN